MAARLILKKGRAKALRRKHPWVFSGAIAEVVGAPAPGEVVDVIGAQGEFLGRAAYSPRSSIRARVWSWSPDEEIDEAFLRARIRAAVERRAEIQRRADTNALRLVHAESDGLPGLVVDQYADTLVVQLLSWSVEAWRETIVKILLEALAPSRIYERSDADVRRLEGLPPVAGWLWGSPLEERLVIREQGLSFGVDIQQGHKTGFYLDQRPNRLKLRQYAQGARVLDCFSYTGGFTVNAMAGGARSVVAIDASAEALQMAQENVTLNQWSGRDVEVVKADVFQKLREFRDRGLTFDLIVLDPPKFAATQAQVERAARGYKDINLLALKLLRPGGYLFTFSCSGGVSPDLFQKIVAGAALDAGVEAQLQGWMFQGADHPVALNFPEGAYLKGLVVQRI